jgi:hypothetical protein
MTAHELPLTDRELRLTAALYALKPRVLEHVKATGELPEHIPTGGSDIAMRWLIEHRGTDIELTADEELVLQAIVRSRRLPGGHPILLDREPRAEDADG